MKILLMLLMLTMLCLSGCSGENSTEETLSEKYNIGEEVELGGEKFNIYKIDDTNNELYLLAQNNVATTIFSESERSSKYLHDYEGSLVEGYVNRFVDGLEDNGYIIKSSGIIDKDDLIELGFDVLDAVFQYGYSDQAHLYHDFKKYHSMNIAEAKRYAMTNVGNLQEEPILIS